MILREINKRLVALITLSLFLLSTSGMVLFSHYCQHANELVFSMYIDSTQEICGENAEIEFQTHHQHENCTHHKTKEEGCCKNHHSDIKTAKLKNDFDFSNRQVTPKPVSISLLVINCPQQFELIHTSFAKAGLPNGLPPEIPIYFPSGKELVTLHHTLKIAC